MTDADKQQYAERAKKVNEDKEEKRLPLVGGAMKKYELRSGLLKEEVVESVDSGTHTPVRKKMITAYILFSTDMRKITVDENPGVRFGEISRIVAERWRAMTDADKQQYAERAKKVNED